jgi:hypothetical protein
MVRRYPRRVSNLRLPASPRGAIARFACVAGLALGSLGAVGAPVALSAELSGGNALGELTKSEPETTTTAAKATTTTTTEEPKNNSSTVFLAIGAGAVLLLGIVFVIMRDVRRVAPAGDVELAEATVARDTALRVSRRRAKAKAARQQRKRNRR